SVVATVRNHVTVDASASARPGPVPATKTETPHGATVTCSIAAIGALRADAATLLKLRRQPRVCAGKPTSPAFLKHADDQTVAAVAVLSQTIEKHHWAGRMFHDWGVAAAPNLFGRFGNEAAFRRFQSEGAWGISPHMIPHHSLHAVSGTISQAWGIRGPNFGVSGGPGAAAEAFLVAGGFMFGNAPPGPLVVFTGFFCWIYAQKGNSRGRHSP